MNRKMSAALAAMVALSALDNLPSYRPSSHVARMGLPQRNAEEAISKAEQKREQRKLKRLNNSRGYN